MTSVVFYTTDPLGLKSLIECFSPQFRPIIEEYKHFECSIKRAEHKLTLICYKKGNKVQIQLSPKSDFSDLFEKIKPLCPDLPIEINSAQKKKSPIYKDNVLAFDEAGWGECFGSIFIGGIRIKNNHDLSKFSGLNGKDIKDLSKKEINYYYSLIEEDSEIKRFSLPITSADIDYSGLNPQRLKDRAFVRAINSLILNSNSTIIIDDYGALDEVKQYLEKLQTSGCEIVLEHDADRNYIHCQLASIVAKKERNDEVLRISSNKENILIDGSGTEIRIEEGANHPNTIQWIELFKKAYPERPIPDFFRKSWSNIGSLCQGHPKRLEVFLTCPVCKISLKKVYFLPLRVKEHRYRFLFCPECEADLSCADFDTKNIYYILPDTSSLIDAVFKTDFTYKNSIFRGKKFIISSIIDREIASKRQDLRNAGLNQIEEISRKHTVVRDHYMFGSSIDSMSFTNDEKVLHALCSKTNFVLVTKDNTMATSAVSKGEFVVHILELNSLHKVLRRFSSEKANMLKESVSKHDDSLIDHVKDTVSDSAT